METLLAWDRALFLWIHSWQNVWLNPIMVFFSEGNKWWSVRLLLLGVWLFLLWRGGRGRPFALCLIPLMIITNETGELLKDWVGRARPCVELGIQALTGNLTSGSFPSLHATNMAALLGLAIACWGRRAWLWLGWLPLIGGLSRVYVGVHYPLDVLGGWVIGGVIGYMAGWGVKRVGEWRKGRMGEWESGR